MSLFTWSTTASSNNTADPSINWREGQAPSTVNNSARAMMAAVAKYRNDVSGQINTGGSSTAYTVTSSQGYTSLMDGIVVVARTHTASGASPTLNVDGLGAKAIRSHTSAPLSGGALNSGAVYEFTYDSGDDCWYIRGFYGISAVVDSQFRIQDDGDATKELTFECSGITTATTVTMAILDNDVEIEGNLVYRAGGTDVPITDGGTGASTAADAFAALKQSATESATGVVELATVAEAETGTDTSRAVTPAGVAASVIANLPFEFAYVDFASNGTINTDRSHGIASVVRNSDGVYTVTLSEPMENRICVGSAGDTTTTAAISVRFNTTSSTVTQIRTSRPGASGSSNIEDAPVYALFMKAK